MKHRHLNGQFRKADKHELMTSNDWDIIRSYNERRERHADWHDENSTPSHALSKFGCVVLFRVKMEWQSDAGEYREVKRGMYVESDTVIITRLDPKRNTDTVWEASREWARAHYRSLLADGFRQVKQNS